MSPRGDYATWVEVSGVVYEDFLLFFKYLIYLLIYLFYVIFSEGGGRGKNISVREKHPLVASCNRGPGPQPRHVP